MVATSANICELSLIFESLLRYVGEWLRSEAMSCESSHTLDEFVFARRFCFDGPSTTTRFLFPEPGLAANPSRAVRELRKADFNFKVSGDSFSHSSWAGSNEIYSDIALNCLLFNFSHLYRLLETEQAGSDASPGPSLMVRKTDQHPGRKLRPSAPRANVANKSRPLFLCCWVRCVPERVQ